MDILTDLPPAAWRRLGPLLFLLALLALVVVAWLVVQTVTLPHRWRHRNEARPLYLPDAPDWAEIVERDRRKREQEQAELRNT